MENADAPEDSTQQQLALPKALNFNGEYRGNQLTLRSICLFPFE